MEDINVWLIVAWILNFLILLFFFRKLLGDRIVQVVEERKNMIDKLKNADEEYNTMIATAKKESNSIISEAEQEKSKIIHEAHLIAESEKLKIIRDGEAKVETMKENAAFEAQKLEKQLKEEWVNSVKLTSKKVVKRLLKHDKELWDEYFGVLVEDLQEQRKI